MGAGACDALLHFASALLLSSAVCESTWAGPGGRVAGMPPLVTVCVRRPHALWPRDHLPVQRMQGSTVNRLLLLLLSGLLLLTR